MAEWIGIGKRVRRCYGFDEIALVPGRVTINLHEVDTTWEFSGRKIDIPILAAAMDGVVDVKFAIAMSKIGGIAVLNLDGVQTRYDNPAEVLSEIAQASPAEATNLIQKLYTKPIKKELIGKRVEEIKKGGGYAAVSCIPQNAGEFAEIAQDSGVDCFVLQSTVATAKHISSKYKPLDLYKFCKDTKVPVIIGNCVT